MGHLNEKLFERHEREFAELVPGGTQTVASGAKLEKHDVRTTQSKWLRWWFFRYELKSTQKKSYSLKLQAWKDLVEYVTSRSAEERPVWAIRFYGESVDRTSDTPVLADLVVLDLNDYVELIEELASLRERLDE